MRETLFAFRSLLFFEILVADANSLHLGPFNDNI